MQNFFVKCALPNNKCNNETGSTPSASAIWSEPEMLRSNIVGERLNSADKVEGVEICSNKEAGSIQPTLSKNIPNTQTFITKYKKCRIRVGQFN